MEIHQSRQYQCNLCDKVFKLSVDRKVHIQKMHEKQNMHKCHSRDEYFSKKSKLLYHNWKIHKEASKFNCNFCYKSFISLEKLRMHFSTAHKNVQFDCSQCDLTFRMKHILLNHFDKAHKRKSIVSTKKVFKCDVCITSYTSENYLKTHSHRKKVKMTSTQIFVVAWT